MLFVPSSWLVISLSSLLRLKSCTNFCLSSNSQYLRMLFFNRYQIIVMRLLLIRYWMLSINRVIFTHSWMGHIKLSASFKLRHFCLIILIHWLRLIPFNSLLHFSLSLNTLNLPIMCHYHLFSRQHMPLTGFNLVLLLHFLYYFLHIGAK